MMTETEITNAEAEASFFEVMADSLPEHPKLASDFEAVAKDLRGQATIARFETLIDHHREAP